MSGRRLHQRDIQQKFSYGHKQEKCLKAGQGWGSAGDTALLGVFFGNFAAKIELKMVFFGNFAIKLKLKRDVD